MNKELLPFDPELTDEQELLVSKLTDEQIAEIDSALLSAAGEQWKKVAMVVATVMLKHPNGIQRIPDVFYSKRITLLVEQGKLVSQGNLRRMRFSEIKLP